MQLEGIHHITAITENAQRNVDFYAGVLGLRLVKTTVNFDDPTAYHLYYGDEGGAPGSIMTFFEYPGAMPGRAGAGMIHTIQWRVGSPESLGFWQERLAEQGIGADLDGAVLRFDDPEGLTSELIVDASGEAPLTARASGIPEEHALRGFAGVRAYSSQPDASARINEALGMRRGSDGAWRLEGAERSASIAYDAAPAGVPRPGAGTVHHIAWATQDAEQLDWQRTAAAHGARPTPVLDRTYFESIYFRVPTGVLYEIATLSPGFAVDEEPEHLGEELRLPPQHEALRPRLAQLLRPIANPRATASA